ncbi:hypothetical protein [Desulfococcus sp.]|uniref:hypothetical protein n=1 Tax=Desulfococcus sp. TaxID=2025834 RepID=UPI003593720D
MHFTHIEHKPFQWIHATGSFVNRCDLDIFLFETRALVVATEREEDRGSGMSITNGAAILATIVMQKYRLHPKALFWIEHYPEKELGGKKIYRMAEVYQRVTFTYQGNRLVVPQWESLDKDGAQAFIDALKIPRMVSRKP